MLSKSFKPAKCKTSLKLAIARIKLLRNKREAQVKLMKKELAQLLETGQEQTARIRVEHVIREEKTMAAYELIELYCELIVARLSIIESQKICPIDLKEAVSSVIFASPRCADVPELMDIRKHFTAKYGKEFINSSLEVRPDCGVSRLVVEKLSARAPDTETKVKMLTAIAGEHNVKWDPKPFEEQLNKPHDDLLKGPATFLTASQMPVESSNVIPSSIPTQSSAASGRISQNDTTSRPTSFSSFSETNRNSGNSVPLTFQPEQRASERRFQGEEVHSYSREENAPLSRPTWNTEFQDATSAAQAAAESAERAGMAARAAVQLASRGNLSRQSSMCSNDSPSSNKKYEKPEKLRVFLDEHVADEVVIPQGMETEAENPEDERVQDVPRGEVAGTASNDYTTGRRPTNQSSYYSSSGSVNDDIFDANLHEGDVNYYSRAQGISSKADTVDPNHLSSKYDNVEFDRGNVNVNSSKAATSHYETDQEIWNSNIYRQGEALKKDTAEVSSGSDNKKSTSGGSFAVVFDNYASEGEDNDSEFGRNRVNVLDSFQEEEPSSFQFDKGLFHVGQDRNKSFAKNSGAQLHLFKDSQPEEQSEIMTKASFSSQPSDSAPPAFDASDGENTESEDEVFSISNKKTMKPSAVLHDGRHSIRASFVDEVTDTSNLIHTGETKDNKEVIRKSRVYEGQADKSLGSTGLPDSQPFPRTGKAPLNANVSVRGPVDSSSDDEEPHSLHLNKRQPLRETEAKGKLRIPSMHLDTKTSEASNEFSDESGLGINFGRLTGGLKHRGYPRPPYVKSSVADASHSSRQTSDSEKPFVSELDKRSVEISQSAEAAYQDRYSQQSQPKAYASQSRTTGASIDSHPEAVKVRATHYTSEDFQDHVDVPAQESYSQRSNRKAYKEFDSNFRGAFDDPDSEEQPHLAIDSRRRRDSASVPRKQNSRASTLDSDGNESKLNSNHTSVSRVKHSRRTKDMPSGPKSSYSETTEDHPITAYDTVTTQGKVYSKSPPSQTERPLVASKQTSATHEDSMRPQLQSTKNVVPTNSGNAPSSSSGGEPVSHEGSLNRASHTHPKLPPDYETFAAHFHALRSNLK